LDRTGRLKFLSATTTTAHGLLPQRGNRPLVKAVDGFRPGFAAVDVEVNRETNGTQDAAATTAEGDRSPMQGTHAQYVQYLHSATA
jgi:hypothetical protein